jgi:hypothetical protein
MRDQGNVEGWNTGNDENTGIGGLGACCAEMDIWGTFVPLRGLSERRHNTRD